MEEIAEGFIELFELPVPKNSGVMGQPIKSLNFPHRLRICNFAFLNHGALVFLALLTTMGRIEVVVVLVLFVPSLWKRY